MRNVVHACNIALYHLFFVSPEEGQSTGRNVEFFVSVFHVDFEIKLNCNLVVTVPITSAALLQPFETYILVTRL